MQLLTVGRSLSEARDEPHRYKLRTNEWPTFGSGGSVVGRSGARTPGRRGVSAETKMKTEAAEKNAGTKQAYPRGRWTVSVNPFRGRAPGPQPATVQGELSLENVRPVRNDLSDADLELIPKTVSAPKENVFAGTAAVTRVSWWGRMKMRLFGRRKK